MNWIPYTLLFFCLISLSYLYTHKRRQQRLRYIDRYFFHKGIRLKLTKKYPHLNEEQLNLVFTALRDYFYICNLAKQKMVAMPSQVVDEAWHEFILSTRFYAKFCNKALGRFLHHTPTEAMSSSTHAQEGIKRAWRLACAKNKINPKHPKQLPLLFAIDDLLGIENGFTYHLNCMEKDSKDGYCASHIGCASGCSGDSGSESSGFFDGASDSNDSSGGSDCGGGCGGD